MFLSFAKFSSDLSRFLHTPFSYFSLTTNFHVFKFFRSDKELGYLQLNNKKTGREWAWLPDSWVGKRDWMSSMSTFVQYSEFCKHLSFTFLLWANHQVSNNLSELSSWPFPEDLCAKCPPSHWEILRVGGLSLLSEEKARARSCLAS